eukprot:6742316-Pyramimonas_sp.AAC.1
MRLGVGRGGPHAGDGVRGASEGGFEERARRHEADVVLHRYLAASGGAHGCQVRDCEMIITLVSC